MSRRLQDRDTDFLVVTQYFPPERGAAQVRLGALCACLRDAGCTVEVVTALPSYPTGRIFPGWRRRPVRVADEDGIRVVRVWAHAAMGSGASRLANYLSFGLMSILGLARTRRARWTVVEYPTLFGAVPAVLWARARSGGVVLNVADLWVDVVVEAGIPGGSAAGAVLERLERWLLARADLVSVVTEGVRDAVVAKGVDPARICWLPNGVDTQLFRPAPRPSGDEDRAADEVATVLYAGTHGHVHGLEVVLDAAEHLAGRPVRFLLVGGGSEKPALVAAARARGLDAVEFRDPVAPEEVARLLGGAAIGLATVRGDPLYRSVRSAKVFPVMAAGLPVVYSGDDEGAALVVAAGAGVSSAPGDGAALADAVLALLADPGAAARMGRAGREWVEANASWDRLVDDWRDQLEDPGRRGWPRS